MTFVFFVVLSHPMSMRLYLWLKVHPEEKLESDDLYVRNTSERCDELLPPRVHSTTYLYDDGQHSETIPWFAQPHSGSNVYDYFLERASRFIIILTWRLMAPLSSNQTSKLPALERTQRSRICSPKTMRGEGSPSLCDVLAARISVTSSARVVSTALGQV